MKRSSGVVINMGGVVYGDARVIADYIARTCRQLAREAGGRSMIDLAPIRACIQSQRPIHWTVAAQLVRELEALRRAHQAPASGDGSTSSPAPAPRSDDAVPGRALSIRSAS